MKQKAYSIAFILFCFSVLTIVPANAGIEYFIKLSSDKQTVHLQNTYTNPDPGDLNITLIDTSQLNGLATRNLVDATMLYDAEDSVYKMWVLVSNGLNDYWSVYYLESDGLLDWNASNIQECYYDISDSYYTRQHSITVLKESDASYKMWLAYYQASGWKHQIWYRSSTDGIIWTEPVLVISAVSLDDWRAPTALYLMNGNYRLYYDYTYRDFYDFLYLYRADVEKNGITTSNITQFAQIPVNTPGYGSILGATIMGDQAGDTHHRVWAALIANDLLRYDSYDEGLNWQETNMGTYDDSTYTIVETFYHTKLLSLNILIRKDSYTTGETLSARAHIVNGDIPSSVETKIWLEDPNGELTSIHNSDYRYIPANTDRKVNIFRYTFDGSEEPGVYKLGGRFLNWINGEVICEDTATYSFTP